MSNERMPKRPPWKVDVDVCLYGVNENPAFEIKSYLQDASNGNLQFHNQGRPGFEIHFELHDETGEQYRFPRRSADALLSSEGKGCPVVGSGQWTEFTAHRIEKNGSVLVVRNLNSKKNPTGGKIEFGYTLRVTKDDGATYWELDPGGDNWNGNWNLM